jgi:hypothetical protein
VPVPSLLRLWRCARLGARAQAAHPREARRIATNIVKPPELLPVLIIPFASPGSRAVGRRSSNNGRGGAQ